MHIAELALNGISLLHRLRLRHLVIHRCPASSQNLVGGKMICIPRLEPLSKERQFALMVEFESVKIAQTGVTLK